MSQLGRPAFASALASAALVWPLLSLDEIAPERNALRFLGRVLRDDLIEIRSARAAPGILPRAPTA